MKNKIGNAYLWKLDNESTFTTEDLTKIVNFRFRIDCWWRKGIIGVILSNSFIPLRSTFVYENKKYKINSIDTLYNDLHAYRLTCLGIAK